MDNNYVLTADIFCAISTIIDLPEQIVSLSINLDVDEQPKITVKYLSVDHNSIEEHDITGGLVRSRRSDKAVIQTSKGSDT